MTTPVMSYKFGCVVRAPFPFTNQTSAKRRPAVIVSSEPYNLGKPDTVVIAITTQLRLNLKFIVHVCISLITVLLNGASASAQTPSLAGAPLDPGKFTTTVAQMINRSGIPQPARITSPLTLKARGADGSDIQINLDRIYQACLGDQADCGEFLSRFVSGARATLLTVIAPAQAATLRVVVRPADYLKDPMGTIMIPVTPPTMPAGLIALLYTDEPTTMRIVNRHDLETLHMSVQQAYDIALRNTMLDLRPFDAVIHKLPMGQAAAMPDNPYESSRLLFHRDWEKWSQKFHSHLLVAVPSAEEVIYAEGGSQQRIDAFSRIAHDRFLLAERGISPSVFEWHPDHWVTAAQ